MLLQLEKDSSSAIWRICCLNRMITEINKSRAVNLSSVTHLCNSCVYRSPFTKQSERQKSVVIVHVFITGALSLLIRDLVKQGHRPLPFCIFHLSLLQNKMSRVMRKPTFCICEKKDADQLRGDREADQRLCFRYIDSTIPPLSKSEISSL